MKKEREIWVDYIKVIACFFVVIGHFVQSMVKSEILPRNDIYIWFNTTIYYFHVPLFFICSGYLYQRNSKISSKKQWIDNIRKKALMLGIPYFVFSLLTWIIKKIFSDSVNEQIGGIIDTLFVHPTSPYWYLYILFFIFIFTPTINEKKRMWVVVGAAIISKVLYIVFNDEIYRIYLIYELFNNEIWFVIGMLMGTYGTIVIKKRQLAIVLGVFFVLLSILVYSNENDWISWGMGALACSAIVMFVNGCKEIKILGFFSKYTMPIFLMHTLFAASFRSILFKIGVDNTFVHIILGIIISFMGPIIGVVILKAIRLDFIVYPERLIRKNDKREGIK